MKVYDVRGKSATLAYLRRLLIKHVNTSYIIIISPFYSLVLFVLYY
jgi:hypothetical protein